MSREIEDGLGHSGLVATRAEREQDRRDQAERKRFKELEALLRKAGRQIDDYREALIEAKDALNMKEDPELVTTRIYLALKNREYLGYEINAALGSTAQRSGDGNG